MVYKFLKLYHQSSFTLIGILSIDENRTVISCPPRHLKYLVRYLVFFISFTVIVLRLFYVMIIIFYTCFPFFEVLLKTENPNLNIIIQMYLEQGLLKLIFPGHYHVWNWVTRNRVAYWLSHIMGGSVY